MFGILSKLLRWEQEATSVRCTVSGKGERMCDSADRRVRKSRAAIFGALEELLQQKSYSSITVGGIIELADVGRTTFYAHFQTKDTLFDELCKDIFAHVLAPMPEDGHSFSTDGAEEQLLHVLCRLSEQRERLAPLFSSPSSHLFWEAIEAHLVTFFAERIGSGVQVRAGLPDGLYAEHLGKTFCEMARWWFSGSLPDRPEAVLSAFCRLTGIRFARPGACLQVQDEARRVGGSGVRQSLKRNLLDLLSEKRLSRITVRELAEKANVGRTAFYSHYPNILAVYQDLVRDALSGVRSAVDQFGCDRCPSSEKVPFCERVRGEDALAAVVEEPQFSKVWLGQLGSDPTSSPARTMLVEAGVARAQAEAITLFHTTGCLMVARSSFGKRDDWHLTRKAIDEFVSGGFARHPPLPPLRRADDSVGERVRVLGGLDVPGAVPQVQRIPGVPPQ